MRLRKKPWIEKAIPEVVEAGFLYREDIERFKGHWQERFPGRELCLEIGCGKGGFITGMAQLHPDKAFIGIETQSDISYYPAKKAMELGLENMVILCADAAFMEDWFAPGEIRTLYLNFSDPWPKSKQAKRRLTHRNFLGLYRKLLGVGGRLFFKTDNRKLFDFSVEEFKAFGLEIRALSYDLHHSGITNEVQTEYEKKFSALGTPINYCEALFTEESGKVETRSPRNIRPAEKSVVD
ncbi:MAG: tRNA (guanosine(46)-N7)-methyltransferase TrmB [Acidaminococcaceae bacterium]|nr:tRNA (guanosine(46)-N7)-methyltransferase TrmB [Acidaminococcaceae bacterium]